MVELQLKTLLFQMKKSDTSRMNKVYGKENLDCIRCSKIAKIKKIMQNGRSTFFCPNCQNNMKSLIFLNFAILLISSLVTAGDFAYGLDDIPVYKI